MFELRNAKTIGPLTAMSRAEQILDHAVTDRTAVGLRARVFELAEALFQSIRMQLSVPRYRAISVGRGANLDEIDKPLNHAASLKNRFDEIRNLPSEGERLAAIAELIQQ